MENLELICLRPTCGFRAASDYFQTKNRFAAHVCPRDNGPLKLVEKGTDDTAVGFRYDPIKRVPVYVSDPPTA